MASGPITVTFDEAVVSGEIDELTTAARAIASGDRELPKLEAASLDLLKDLLSGEIEQGLASLSVDIQPLATDGAGAFVCAVRLNGVWRDLLVALRAVQPCSDRSHSGSPGLVD